MTSRRPSCETRLPGVALADEHRFQHGTIEAPFRPVKYADAIAAAEKAGAAVVIVDSASHEWSGDGGCLDWHDEIMGRDQKKTLMAWIEPKRSHKKMLTRLLQLNAHVILCFRAEPKVETVNVDGRTVIKPKRSLTGLVVGDHGWIPVSEPNMPYELTASFLLTADAPGIPKPIKLPDPLKPLVPLDRPLDESVGKALAAWATGANRSVSPAVDAGAVDALVEQLLELADGLGKRAEVEKAIATKRASVGITDPQLVDWLGGQIDRARKKAA
jgi:hypothetical protein